MFVIFGIRRKAHRLATVFALCRLCGSPAAQVVSRVGTFFSLFFIPVIPLGITYRSTCTLCGRTVKITKEEADQLVAHAGSASAAPGPAPSAFPPPVMPPPATPTPPAAAPPTHPTTGS